MSNSGKGPTTQAEPLPPPQPIPTVRAELEDDELTCERNLHLLDQPPSGWFEFGIQPTHVKVYYSRSAVDECWYWDRVDVAQETRTARAAVTYLRRDAPPWLADLADYHAPPK